MNDMNKVTNLLCAFLCFAQFLSCKPKEKLPGEYLAYLKEDKKINKTITVGEVEYTFRIQTPELMALKAATDGNNQTDVIKYKQRLAELEGYLYVNIEMQVRGGTTSILKYNVSDKEAYDQRVMYYEFYAKDDLKLICNGKELPPQSYQYENHLDLMPFNTLVVAFPLCKDSKEFQVNFNDRALNNLFVKVSFNQEDIKSLPQLVLN